MRVRYDIHALCKNVGNDKASLCRPSTRAKRPTERRSLIRRTRSGAGEADGLSSRHGRSNGSLYGSQASADGESVGEAGDDHGQFGRLDRFSDVHPKTCGQRLQTVLGAAERRQGDGGNLV
jgi:hypothetical protein